MLSLITTQPFNTLSINKTTKLSKVAQFQNVFYPMRLRKYIVNCPMIIYLVSYTFNSKLIGNINK